MKIEFSIKQIIATLIESRITGPRAGLNLAIECFKTMDESTSSSNHDRIDWETAKVWLKGGGYVRRNKDCFTFRLKPGACYSMWDNNKWEGCNEPPNRGDDTWEVTNDPSVKIGDTVDWSVAESWMIHSGYARSDRGKGIIRRYIGKHEYWDTFAEEWLQTYLPREKYRNNS